MRRSTRLVRQSSETFSSRSPVKSESPEEPTQSIPKIRKKGITSASNSDAYESSTDQEIKPTTKKRKTSHPAKRSNGNAAALSHLFADGLVSPNSPLPCTLPRRQHSLTYHRPLLLDQARGRASLLTWFDSVTETRGMPWRKPWIDPASVSSPAELRSMLERRAYEVWISEIMLQQTRVAVVIDYWNRWMAKWPTIHELAAADPEDVLAMWRGLGYYSRATRIHEAAKLVCGDPSLQGLLPQDVVELERKVPGVGRYTAGAISAIVFGRAAPMVDGNVLRVLSRQLGVLGDVKADRKVIDALWAAADALVKAVAKDVGESDEGGDFQESNRPGRWGQALMELGSTVCTPKPNCGTCPITATCRAYAEGLEFSSKKGMPTEDSSIVDIEDSCSLCKSYEEHAVQDEEDEKIVAKLSSKKSSAGGNKKQASLQSFFFAQSQSKKPNKKATSSSEPDATVFEVIVNHARKFPVKVIKKAVREEETIVCAIRRKGDNQFLIQRRPEKGLLAGLWEFPSYILPGTNDSTAKTRKGEAANFVKGLLESEKGLKHVGELGSVPWLFSHLRLTMHVHLFELEDRGNSSAPSNGAMGRKSRWSGDVDAESMGTGMRKCWTLVKESTE
ncbi:hypothetical protein JX266_003117 [Neoarthrinium moseri]|nr:hypothetical protein JX266_003117 [Neoarthrinium moseri]